MIEFQSRVTTIEASIMAALKGAPFCLPTASYGVQIQRVQFESVRVVHDVPTTAVIAYDQWTGPKLETIDTLQTQIIVRCDIGFTRVASIQATPNALVPTEASLTADVVMDFNCFESMGNPIIVRSRTRVRFDAMTVTDDSLPPWLKDAVNAWIAAQMHNPAHANDVERAEAWATDQLVKVLPPSTIPFSLESLAPTDSPTANTGISVNDARDCLSIRADHLTANASAPQRWKDFLNSHFDSVLADNDWAVVMPAEELKLTLQTRIWSAMRTAMGSEAWRLVTLGVDYYAPQPNVARFTITPWLKVPTLGTEDLPINLELSLDPIQGRLQVDIDAYGVRELVDDFTSVLNTVLSLVLPIVSLPAIIALQETVADLQVAATKAIATAGSGAITDEVGSAGQFEALPGPPFRFRASVPLELPQGIPGRINELRALPDSVAVAGSWGMLHWRDAQLQIDVGQFGWHVPKSSCSGMDGLIATLQRAPLLVTYPEAWIGLGTTGSAPITVCGVDVIDDGGAPGSVKVTIDANQLPTRIGVSTSATFADLPEKRAVRLNVRTSAGVFQVLLAPPEPLTPYWHEFIVNTLRAVARRCVVAVGPWFGKSGHINIADWIVNPLLDPDPDRLHVSLNPEIVRIEVRGLPEGARLQLGSADQAQQVQVTARADEVASLSYWAPLGKRGDSMRLQHDMQADRRLIVSNGRHELIPHVQPSGAPSAGAAAERSVAVTRQLLTPLGRVLLSEQAYAVCAAPAWGNNVFAVALESGCVLLDASGGGTPRLGVRWPFRGLRGVLPTRQGLLGWGEAGVLHIDARSSPKAEQHCEYRAVRAAGAAGSWMALLYGDDLVLANEYGSEVHRLQLPDVQSVGFAGPLLVTATTGEIRTHRVSRSGNLDAGELLLHWGTDVLLSSPSTGSLFAHHAEGRWVEIGPDGHSNASHAEQPWDAQTAKAGFVWVRLGAGAVLETYRASPPIPAAPHDAGNAATLPS